MSLELELAVKVKRQLQLETNEINIKNKINAELKTDINVGLNTQDGTITPLNILEGNIGYSQGLKVVGELKQETVTATPLTTQQEINAESGKLFNKVIVNPVTSAIDNNLIPINIRSGVTILGVEGNLEPDKPDQEKTVFPTIEDQVVVGDTGYELAKVTVKGMKLGDKEINSNGTYTASAEGLDGYKVITVDIKEDIKEENIKIYKMMDAVRNIQEGGTSVTDEEYEQAEIELQKIYKEVMEDENE